MLLSWRGSFVLKYYIKLQKHSQKASLGKGKKDCGMTVSSGSKLTYLNYRIRMGTDKGVGDELLLSATE